MAEGSTYSEQELLARVARGDQGAFSLVVDRYWQKIYGHALAYCKSVNVAEELTQDIFMAIWNNRAKLPELDHFANYLFIITRNRILNALRKKLEQSPRLEDIDPEEDIWLPDQQLEYREIHRLILEGIQALPPVRQKVFSMSRLDGLSYDQISAELHISRNTVKEHIVKALNDLRNYLARHRTLMAWALLWLAAGAVLFCF